MTDSNPDHERTPGGWQKPLIICLIIAALGAGSLFLIFYTEPGAVKEGATRKTAMLVDVIEVQGGDFRPVVVATGVVVPSQRVELRPRISGEVLTMSDNLVPGGLVKEGELLLALDRNDYELALQRALAELEQARANLTIEMGQQAIAKTEYELMKENLRGERKALVLREPQLDIAKAEVQAAETAVEQARLNLERTRILAPFDGQITERDVNVGSQVGVGDSLAHLVGTESYWVEATVPVSKVHQLRFTDPLSAHEQDPSPVKVKHRSAWPEGVYRQGWLTRLIGELNRETRLARVLVTVDNPMATNSEKPPLMLGAFVEAEIEGAPLKDVVKLSRDYLRTNDRVWVMHDGQLDIRQAVIAFRDSTHVYVSEGLQPGEKVVTTNLATITQGAKLRLMD